MSSELPGHGTRTAANDGSAASILTMGRSAVVANQPCGDNRAVADTEVRVAPATLSENTLRDWLGRPRRTDY